MKKSWVLVLVLASFILSLNFIFADTYNTPIVPIQVSGAPLECRNNATSAYWFNTSTNTNLGDASNACLRFADITGEACCPTKNNICDNGKCHGLGYFCSDFNTSSSCTNAGSVVALNSVPNASICGASKEFFNQRLDVCYNFTNCKCYWDSAIKTCLSSSSYSMKCYNATGLVSSDDLGTCYWEITKKQDNCNTTKSNIIYQAVAKWISSMVPKALQPKWCASYEKILQCPSTVKLSFVSDMSLILGVLLLIIVYVYLAKKRKVVKKVNIVKKLVSKKKK